MIKTIFLTGLALSAFAGNSVLCRLALGENQIDPASFTIIRLLSGVVALWLLITVSGFAKGGGNSGSWYAALALFIYAIMFSLAYVLLETGVGALILFGAVQITMVVVGVFLGHRLRVVECLGLFIAFTGFIYLMWPSFIDSMDNISLTGVMFMLVSGIAWGSYTLIGRGSLAPLQDSAQNFTKTLPFVLLLFLVFLFQPLHITVWGVVLAIISGAVASGVGYAVWYAALNYLSAIQAAVVQLLVPIIAAIGGVVFAEETIDLRLIIASIGVLGGVLLIIMSPKRV